MRLVTVPGVFRPRSDSWLLARSAAARTAPGATVLDPFTGSGVVALAAAAAGATATAVDISRRAVACVRANALLNGLELRTIRAATLAPLGDERFDLIAANPPYLPGPAGRPRGAARAWEGGPDGRRFIDRICADASKRLNPGGRLLLIHSSVCGESATLAALEAAGLDPLVVERHRGPLGPLLAPRAAELRAAGLLDQDGKEDVLLFEARAPGSGGSLSRFRFSARPRTLRSRST